MNNSQQIGNIKTFNSLMGGLATNTTSLLMGGNANLNLLSFKGVGMLEFSFGKDGIKSKIGMGGTNISIQNLVGAFGGATNLHKNSQINKTGYDKTVLDALRSQYGFGDKTAKKQLEEIIKRDTILKFDAKGSEVAQSITENGQKIIHINSSQNEGFIDLGLTLQHEAHRDGIISDEQSQYIETVNAVAGHTQMALAMAIDKLYTKDMLNHISSDSNLQNDINAYMYAAYTGNAGLFAGYVGASYDSSADYWRVHENGTVTWDGQLNFYKDGETDKNNAEAGKLLDYRNLDEVIENANKDGLTTVMLGGIEVDVERLKEISATNKELILASKSSNTYASKALINDGFLSKNEADISLVEINKRDNYKNLINTFFATFFSRDKAPFNMYDEKKDSVDIIEHYSTRYVLNENDEFKKYFLDKSNIDIWSKNKVRGKSTFQENYFESSAVLLSKAMSAYHGENCLKWQFENGSELVLGYTTDGYYFETNEKYFGTFNFGTDGTGKNHKYKDVIPYWKWGNTPEDMTSNKARIHPVLEYFYPSYTSNLERYNAHH